MSRYSLALAAFLLIYSLRPVLGGNPEIVMGASTSTKRPAGWNVGLDRGQHSGGLDSVEEDL